MLSKETEYHLHGVICHEGVSYKVGHYFCYLLEMFNDQVCNHLLNDHEHESVTEASFKKDVEAKGYIYLYSTDKVGTYNSQPYSGHDLGICSLKDDMSRFFRSRQPNRNVKAKRDSEGGTNNKQFTEYLRTASSLPATRKRKNKTTNNVDNKKPKLNNNQLKKSSCKMSDKKSIAPGKMCVFHLFKHIYLIDSF